MDPVIETDRLLIRPLTLADMHSVAEIIGDSYAMRFVDRPKQGKDAKEQLWHWTRDYKKDGFGFMALIQKKDNAFIGYAGFLRQTVEKKEYIELGYIISPEYWDLGFATEAALALKNYGLTKLGFSNLIAIIHEKNAASIRVATKIGMTFFLKTELEGKPYVIYRCEKT